MPEKLRDRRERLAKAAVAGWVEGEVVDLRLPLPKGGAFRILTKKDPEALRVLRHSGVQVVLDHQHDRRGLLALGRVMIDRPGMHRMLRTQAVHVDAAVVLQLLRELRCQRGVVLRMEVAQGIAQGELLLFCGKDVLALGRVTHRRVKRARRGKDIGDAFLDGLAEEGEVRTCGYGWHTAVAEA